MRRRKGLMQAGVLGGCVSALVFSGCALGATLPLALATALLAALLLAGCGSQSLGSDGDAGLDAGPTPDASLNPCGEGICPEEGLACVVPPGQGPWCFPDADGDGLADVEE